MNNESLRAVTLSRRDQMFAYLRSNRDQLERIEEDGPETQDDINLVKDCVCLVIGDICMAEIAEEEADAEEF